MRVSFEIKGSKPEFSVNRLFYVFPRSLLIASVMNFEKLGRFFPWFFPNRKCTSRNVEMNGNFFVRSIFVKLFKCFILCFKVTLLCFIFVAILNPIHKRLHALMFKTIKFKTTQILKNIRIGKFGRDIFSFLLTVTSYKTRRKNEFFKSKLRLHDKKSSWGTNILFNLNDFSNYGSSDYRSFLIWVY